MRVLLSTIGSRGDVQPLVALALELKALDAEVRLCVPPDFREWVEGLGIPVTPIGPVLRSTARPSATTPTPDQRRQLMEATVATQFETISVAAEGCDAIIAATALQIAARSVAERLSVPYVFAAFCPAVLPSPHHAPPVLTMLGDTPAPALADYRELWAQDAARWSLMWGELLNAHRTAMGLAPVSDVRRHILTDRPWLAADPALAPWPGPADPDVFQTGAWILTDERPLSPELQAFLDDGEPPVCLGFGSIRAPEGLGDATVTAARRLGRRVIVSRGWAGLSAPDGDSDCLAIGEVNQQVLFSRVAVVVHHGGAGTTTAAARAGVPQLVIPQHYDQFYWAERVSALGVGRSHLLRTLTPDALVTALEGTLQAGISARARSVAGRVRSDGARNAAESLLADGRRRFA
jgi:vancomycin aglycone glucosyltransferase